MNAVILAAGLSKRFGGKKLLEKVNYKSMVLHVTDLVSSLDFKQKLIIYSDSQIKSEIIKNCPGFSEFKFFYNEQAQMGISTSIKLAVTNLESDTINDGIMFFVADQPFINAFTVNKLIDAFHEQRGTIILPLYGENRGNPVIFSNKWIQQLMNLEGDVGGRSIIRKNPNEVWQVPIMDFYIGQDIDTKEKYKSLIQSEGKD